MKPKKNYLMIARESDSSFAIETKLRVLSGKNRVTYVVIVNVPHARYIAAGIQQIQQKIHDKKISVDLHTENFVNKLANISGDKRCHVKVNEEILHEISSSLGFPLKQEMCIMAH